jgi:capsid protein
VLHWFAQDRSGQYRGIPELYRALPLFAQLRRFTLATVVAAEAAALAAGVVKSDGAPFDGEGDNEDIPEPVEIERGMWVTLPRGQSIEQIKAEHPSTTYAEFKRALLGEIGACVSMPVNIATGDSSQHNFASGRLDQQVYGQSVWIRRDDFECRVLRRIAREWMREARLIPGYAPADLPGVGAVTWNWDALDLGDPSRIAAARDTALRNGTATLRQFAAEDGYDLDEQLATQATDLGLTVDELRQRIANKLFSSYVMGAPVATEPMDDSAADPTDTPDAPADMPGDMPHNPEAPHA